MSTQPSGFPRFRQIVSASPLAGLVPPIINTQFIHSTNPADSAPSAKKRKRANEDNVGPLEKKPGRKVSVPHFKLYEGREQLLNALRQAFQQGPDVEFNGGYEAASEVGVSHKSRVVALTHAIWRTTGYRFTVKDHPKIAGGIKTRFCCSQDIAQKNKAKGARHPGDTPKPRLTSSGDAMAKTRYHCRSRLLISSRDSDKNNCGVVTIRIAHHLAHEPYLPDSSPPPEPSKAFYESFGWSARDQSDGDSATSLGQLNKDPRKSMPGNSDPREVSDDTLPIAVAPSQLHAPSHEMEEEYEEDDGEDMGQEHLGESVIPPQINGAFSTSQSIAPTSGAYHGHQAPPLPTLQHPPSLGTLQQRLQCQFANLRQLCAVFDYQLQYSDAGMLDAMEKECGPFFDFVQQYLQKHGRPISAPSAHSVHASHSSNGMGQAPLSLHHPHTLATNHLPQPRTSEHLATPDHHSGMQGLVNGVNGYG